MCKKLKKPSKNIASILFLKLPIIWDLPLKKELVLGFKCIHGGTYKKSLTEDLNVWNKSVYD